MRIRAAEAETILEAVKEALEGELDFNLNDTEDLLVIDSCGVSAELNKEELYRFIEELTEMADSMME